MKGRWTVVLTEAADRDIDDIVAESIRLFGPAQARAYEELLAAAISDLRGGPKLIGSVSRSEIAVSLGRDVSRVEDGAPVVNCSIAPSIPSKSRSSAFSTIGWTPRATSRNPDLSRPASP